MFANISREEEAKKVPDQETNRAIREIASTPTAQHLIPASVVELLYGHVDFMREAFFAGAVPPVVLSFDVKDRRNLGHYCLARNGLGVLWNINLNPVHLGRPLFEVLATLLHEVAHSWQYDQGTGAKPPHHNREFVAKCEEMGIPTNAHGHYLGVIEGGAFHRYCEAHGVPFVAAGVEGDQPGKPEPLLPVPPVKPTGSRLRKWICGGCQDPVPVRVARDDWDARCNLCGTNYHLA